MENKSRQRKIIHSYFVHKREPLKGNMIDFTFTVNLSIIKKIKFTATVSLSQIEKSVPISSLGNLGTSVDATVDGAC